MRYSEHNGVRFYEGNPCASSGQPLEVRIGGLFAHAQLKTLGDVKSLMASECVKRGHNAVVNFKYGQKGAGLLASLFSLDDTPWYGTGQSTNMEV